MKMSRKSQTKRTRSDIAEEKFYAKANRVQNRAEAKDWKRKRKLLWREQGEGLVKMAQEDEDKVFQTRLERARREGMIKAAENGWYEMQRLGIYPYAPVPGQPVPGQAAQLSARPDIVTEPEDLSANNNSTPPAVARNRFNPWAFDATVYEWARRYKYYYNHGNK